MKKKIFLISLIALLLCLSSGQGEERKEENTVKRTMNSVFTGFLGLIPFMGDQDMFNNPKYREEIHTHLTTIKTAFDNAKHIKTFKLPGLNPSFTLVKLHLKETLEAFELGQPNFARARLRATGQLCISCHTQLKENRGSFKLLKSLGSTDFKSSYEYAEFLFLIRSYKKSQRYYDKEIISTIINEKKISEKLMPLERTFSNNKIEESLEKLLSINTKVDYNPSSAIHLLQKYKNNKYLKKSTQLRVKNWLVSLNNWIKDTKFNGIIKTDKELDRFLKRHKEELTQNISLYDGRHDVSLLVASGVLFSFLNKFSTPETTPKILYWIARVDYLLGHSYLYSLSELYLKRCITGYSESIWAKKCFNSYKEKISLGYTGSAGTFIPKDERLELKRLNGLIKRD